MEVPDIAPAKADISRAIRRLENARRATFLQSYLGSPFKVLGLSVPQTRTIVRRFAKTNRSILTTSLNSLTDMLWHGDAFEEKAVAMELLVAFRERLDESTWKMADRWVNEAVGWALCDSLGSGPISSMLLQKEDRFAEVLKWASAANLWRRRVSAYAMRDFVHLGRLDKPFRLLRVLVKDDEFWVQRAAGTWLRECWKKDRARTEAFLRKNVGGMPKVVITVATERAPRSLREELRTKREWNRGRIRSRA